MATTAVRPRRADLHARPDRRARHRRGADDRVLLAGLAAIALLAAVLRFADLGAHLPALISPDEPTVARRALAVLDGNLVPPQWDWPPLSSYLLAGALLLVRPFAPDLVEDPARLYLFGRAVFATVSVAAVVLTGLLGAAVVPRDRPGSRRLVAWGAAAATAVCYLLVRSGRLVHPEQLQPLLMIGSLLCTFRLAAARRAWPWVLGAGVLAGAAGATKYVGVIGALPLAVAVLQRHHDTRSRVRLLAGAVGATVLGFVVGTLGTVFRWGHFTDGLAGQFAHQATGHLGYEPTGPGWWFHVTQSLPGGWGWPLTVLAVGGLVVGLADRGRPRLVAVTAVPVAVAVTLGQVRFPHYVVIALPFLAVLAGLALDRLATAVRSRAGGTAAAVLVAAMALSLVPPLLDDVRLVRAAAAPDTRLLVAERVASLDPAVPVWGEAYATAGRLDHQAFSWAGEPEVLDCACHVLVSSVQEGRYRARPERYADEVAIYDQLRARGRVVDVVAPSQPLDYRWDLLPQWGIGRLPVTGEVGTLGPTVTVLDLR